MNEVVIGLFGVALFEQQAQIKTGLLINWLKSNLVLMQKQSLFLDILSEIPISILSPSLMMG